VVGSVKDTEIAWAAGFFDGEGSVFVNRIKRQKGGTTGKMYPVVSVSLSISQVEPEPLERFTRAVGGRKPMGPYKPRHANAKPYYRWDACGRPSVHRVLCLLWPYMSGPKKRQARKVWATLKDLRTNKSPVLPPLPEEVV